MFKLEAKCEFRCIQGVREAIVENKGFGNGDVPLVLYSSFLSSLLYISVIYIYTIDSLAGLSRRNIYGGGSVPKKR